MSTEYYYKNREKILAYQKKYRAEHKEERKKNAKKYVQKPKTEEQKIRLNARQRAKRLLQKQTDPEYKLKQMLHDAKQKGGIVFTCAKCGTLATSKNHEQTLCHHCRKQTEEQRKEYQKQYHSKNRERMIAYMREYHKIGKIENICNICGLHFWYTQKKDICSTCSKKNAVLLQRQRDAKQKGGIVFTCAKCGTLATSKNHEQTLCHHCRKKTEEQRKEYQKQYHSKNDGETITYKAKIIKKEKAKKPLKNKQPPVVKKIYSDEERKIARQNTYKKYYRTHKDKIRAYCREWEKKHPKTTKICIKCGKKFKTRNKEKNICSKCLTLKTNRL